MTKSELIERLATQQSHIPAKAVEDAVGEYSSRDSFEYKS